VEEIVQCKEWRQKDCVKHEKGIFNNNVIPTTPFNNVTGKYDQQIHTLHCMFTFMCTLATCVQKCSSLCR
jgi:hypothetical protein